MKDEIAVICSRADPASLNIFESLLKLQDWKPGQGYLSSGRWRLLIHEGKQSTLSGVDELLEEQALEPEFIVFASRHEAKSALPWVAAILPGQWRVSSSASLLQLLLLCALFFKICVRSPFPAMPYPPRPPITDRPMSVRHVFLPR